MLRVSSLGLRWYRHTSHATLSPLTWRTYHTTSLRAAASRAKRVVPPLPSVRLGEAQNVEKPEDAADKIDGEDAERGNVVRSRKQKPRQQPQPHYPWGNRKRRDVRPLRYLDEAPPTVQDSEHVPDQNTENLEKVSGENRKERCQEMPHNIEVANSASYECLERDITDIKHMAVLSPESTASKAYAMYNTNPATPSPDATHGKTKDPHRKRRKELLDLLATTSSHENAWTTYHELMSLPRPPRENGRPPRPPVPWGHLHRLARLIAVIRPRTRTLFLRLLSVVSTIHKTGGTVAIWEWNALIDFAGKGWRRTSLENYMNSLEMYDDLLSGLAPGAAFTKRNSILPTEEANPDAKCFMKPDIVTVTTLLNIATRTGNENAIRDSQELIARSGLEPNRITYLAMLTYYGKKGRLHEVQRILNTMHEQRHMLGMDGLNQVIWAYAYNARFDTPRSIYKLLRHNLIPNPDLPVNNMLRSLSGGHIEVPVSFVPDLCTYMIMLQSYSFRGHFAESIEIFMDMVSSFIEPSGSTRYRGPTRAEYLYPAFRAMFLGFYRFGRVPEPALRRKWPYRYSVWHDNESNYNSLWTLDALQALYNDFLCVEDVYPPPRVIYWIIMAFARASGNNLVKLRQVCSELEERFGGNWGGRLATLKEMLEKNQEKS